MQCFLRRAELVARIWSQVKTRSPCFSGLLSCGWVSLTITLVSFPLGLLGLIPGQRQTQVNPSTLVYLINLVFKVFWHRGGRLCVCKPIS